LALIVMPFGPFVILSAGREQEPFPTPEAEPLKSALVKVISPEPFSTVSVFGAAVVWAKSAVYSILSAYDVLVIESSTIL